MLVGDTRIGVEGPFKIGLNEVAISIPLPVMAIELVRERLSERHHTEATLQARIYTPDDAVKVGYLDRLVAPESLFEEAFAEARRLTQLPATAYAQTKMKLRGATLAHIRDTLKADTTSPS